MRSLLLVGAAALATATALSAQAAEQPKRDWLANKSWAVWQTTLNDGHQGCFLKQFLPAEQSNAAFGLSHGDTLDAGQFYYTEDGITSTGNGILTLQVDNRTPWQASSIRSDDQGSLIFSLGRDPSLFLSELQFGHALRVTTANGGREFSLAGSNQAVTALLSCVQKISVQQRGAVAAPLPAPRSGPQPSSVNATDPARTL